MSRLAKGFIVFWVLYALLAVIALAMGGIDTTLAVLWLLSAVCGVVVWISTERAKKRSKKPRQGE